MDINWRAVLTGFVVAVVVGFGIALVAPLDQTSALLLALPGLVGGFTAGYMVSGVGRGAIHGGLATVIGAVAVLALVLVGAVLFVGIVPALTGGAVALVAILAQAIPGAIAGALGGWLKARRPAEAPTSTTPR